MESRKTCLRFLAVALLLLGAVALANALVDPYQILHRSLLSRPLYSSKQSYQNLGLINSYLASADGYDTVVVGTSLDSGYAPEEIQARLGTGKALVLTMNGSTLREQAYVLEKALATGRVRRVLWGIFSSAADSQPDRLRGRYTFPFALYEGKPGGVAQYLLNLSTLKDGVEQLCGAKGWRPSAHAAYDWNPASIKDGSFQRYSTPEKLARHAEVVAQGKPALEAVLRGLDGWLPGGSAQAAPQGFPAIDANLAPVLARHPEVRFDLVIPPLPALHFHERTWKQELILAGVQVYDEAGLTRQMAMRVHLAELAERLPNARLFAMDDDFEATGNLANYIDSWHFSHLVSNRVLDHIAKGEHRVTAQGAGEYVRRLLTGLIAYRLYSDRERSLWGRSSAD